MFLTIVRFLCLVLPSLRDLMCIVEMKTQIKIYLPTNTPDQAIIHLTSGRLPRLIS